jgi:DUF4097 and DUF4098 domain-containing protein YvlB
VGRRRLGFLLILLIFVLILLALGALFLRGYFGGTVSGTRTIEDSIDSGQEPRIRLINGRGEVSIEGVDGLSSVEFEATKYALGPDEEAARRNASEIPTDFSREESEVEIKTGGARDTGADYSLKVPKGSSLEVENGAGDVRITGVEGDVAVRSESGDMTVANSGGSVTVEAAAGDVSLSGLRTDTGQVDLVVGAGDLTLEDLVLGNIEARVESGDVTLSGRFSGGGRISVETGDVTSRLPQDDTRELTLEARVGKVLREDPVEEE